MTNCKYVLVSILFLIVACNKTENSDIFHEPIFMEHKELRGEIINISPYFLNKTQEMLIYNNYLLIEDYYKRDHVFKLFDLTEGMIIDEFCGRGKGPGELTFPSSNMVYDKLTNEVQLFDPNTKKLIVFKGIKPTDFENDVKEYRCLKNREFITELFKVNDQYLGWTSGSTSENKRFVLLDENLKIYKELGDFINPIKEMNNEIWKKILNYATQFAISPDMTKLVLGTYIGGYLEIYDLTKLPENICLIDTLLLYKPIYKEESNGKSTSVRWYGETTIGFEDIFVSDKYIYALLNGCKGDKYTMPNKISVFDFTGNPIVEYHLDKHICSLAVDEDNGVIYATEYHDLNINLIKFKL